MDPEIFRQNIVLALQAQ